MKRRRNLLEISHEEKIAELKNIRVDAIYEALVELYPNANVKFSTILGYKLAVQKTTRFTKASKTRFTKQVKIEVGQRQMELLRNIYQHFLVDVVG